MLLRGNSSRLPQKQFRSSFRNLRRCRAFQLQLEVDIRSIVEAAMKNLFSITLALIPLVAVVSACVAVP